MGATKFGVLTSRAPAIGLPAKAANPMNVMANPIRWPISSGVFAVEAKRGLTSDTYAPLRVRGVSALQSQREMHPTSLYTAASSRCHAVEHSREETIENGEHDRSGDIRGSEPEIEPFATLASVRIRVE